MVQHIRDVRTADALRVVDYRHVQSRALLTSPRVAHPVQHLFFGAEVNSPVRTGFLTAGRFTDPR